MTVEAAVEATITMAVPPMVGEALAMAEVAVGEAPVVTEEEVIKMLVLVTLEEEHLTLPPLHPLTLQVVLMVVTLLLPRRHQLVLPLHQEALTTLIEVTIDMEVVDFVEEAALTLVVVVAEIAWAPWVPT
jgi:hypothetical protein